MPKYTTESGVKIECTEEQAAFLGLKQTADKAPAKRAASKASPEPKSEAPVKRTYRKRATKGK